MINFEKVDNRYHLAGKYSLTFKRVDARPNGDTQFVDLRYSNSEKLEFALKYEIVPVLAWLNNSEVKSRNPNELFKQKKGGSVEYLRRLDRVAKTIKG